MIREGEKSHGQGSRSESTLWEIDYKDQDTQTTHETQKPVECMRRPMLNNSEQTVAQHAARHIIYEPFSGSGTGYVVRCRHNHSC